MGRARTVAAYPVACEKQCLGGAPLGSLQQNGYRLSVLVGVAPLTTLTPSRRSELVPP